MSVSPWIIDDSRVGAFKSRCTWVDVVRLGDTGEGTGTCGVPDTKVAVSAVGPAYLGSVGTWSAEAVRITGSSSTPVEVEVAGGYFLVAAPALAQAQVWPVVDLIDGAGRTVATARELAVPGSAAPAPAGG